MRRARAGGEGGGGAGSAGSGAGGDGGGAEEVHKARAGRGGAEEATPAGLAAVAQELLELRAAVTKAHAEKPGAETAEALAAVDAAMTVPVAVAGRRWQQGTWRGRGGGGGGAGAGRQRTRTGRGEARPRELQGLSSWERSAEDTEGCCCAACCGRRAQRVLESELGAARRWRRPGGGWRRRG